MIDVIVVLGGGLKKDKNGWRTTNFDESGDNFGVQGDRLRVDATYYLYKKFSSPNKNLLIISSGGRGQLRNISDSPSVSSVIKKELVALGVPKEKILLEENSNNTYQQLQQLILIIQNFHLKNCLILSNGWHLHRIRAMIEYGPGLDFLKERLTAGNLSLVSAEQVLIDSNPSQWKELIDVALGSVAMQERVKKEAQGVVEIKSGLYKFQ
ncbi:MAG: YdcF family protein [bacterium]|nr:YdcF family protein [bacterium]